MKIRKHLLLLLVCTLLANFSNAQIHRWKLNGDLKDAITGKSAVAVDTGAGAAGISYVTDPVHGKVLKLDGSAYVKLPDSLFKNISDFTITCWVKADGYTQGNKGHWEHVFSFGNKSTTAPWNIVYYTPNDGGGSRFTFGSHGNWQDLTMKDTAASLNHWDSLSIVKRGSSLITYKNGVLYSRIDTLISAARNFRGAALFPDTVNTIGQSYWADPLLKGLVSDLCIFSNGPIHQWPLKGNLSDVVTGQTAVAVDTGVGAAGISYVTDPDRGQVLKLDGSAYVKLADSLFQTISDFTITCWVKADGYAQGNKGHWEHVFSFGNKSTSAPWNIVYYTPNDGGGSRFTFGSHGNWQDLTMKDTAASLNHWDSLSFVRKGSSLITYKNGVLYGRIDTLIGAADNFKGGALFPDTVNTIGQSYWADPLLKGLVSDMRIYLETSASKGDDLVLAKSVSISSDVDTIYIDTVNFSVTKAKLTVKISPDNTTIKTVKWSVNDKTIATLSPTGVLTPNKVGSVVITAVTQDGTNFSATKTIIVMYAKQVVSIKGSAMSEFSIFPNPASTEIIVSLKASGNAIVQIYSITGAQVLSKSLIATNQATLNIENLAKGLYIVRVSDVKGTMAQKLIVK
jgi:hypothetical protein